jgi:2'-5' RNA ligase
MRLFVAVDRPEAVKGSLDAAAAPLRAALPRARWVRPDGFHLTLAFLGETDQARIPALSRGLREKLEQEGGFRAHFSGLGSFPNAGAVRVLWVGLEPSVRFMRLAELVQDGLRAAGCASDEKPFRSHVTLARCEPAWPAQQRTVLGELANDFGERSARVSFACDRVTLFSSTLGKGGATYRGEEFFPLQAP